MKWLRKSPGRLITLLALIAVGVPFLFNSCDGGIGGLVGFGGQFQAARSCYPGELGPGQVRKINGLFAEASEPIPSVFSGKKLILDNPSGSSMGQQKLGAGPSSLAPGQKLVALVYNSCLAEKNNLGGPQSLSQRISQGQQILSELEVQTYTFSLEKGISLEQLEADINADECIRGVGPQKTYQLSSLMGTYNDPSIIYQAHLAAIKADLAYEEFFHEEYGIPASAAFPPVKIAVIDTGVSFTHKDLENSIWRHGTNFQLWGLNALTLGTNNVDYNPSDVSPIGHGTHVSGIIAATANNSRGGAGIVAQGGKIMAIKVFYDDGNGQIVSTTDVLVKGMLWAIQNGADVVNMSLGRLIDGTKESLYDPVYQDAIAQALNAGAVVVTATGNSTSAFPAQELNDTTFNVVPARYGYNYQGAINVGSVDIDNQGNLIGRSGFSHYSNRYVEIAAPGFIQGTDGIYSTLPVNGTSLEGAYGYLPGTSQSAPMVSSAAALAIALYRAHFGGDPAPSTVEKLILDSAQKNAALANQFKDGNVLDLKGLADLMHVRYPEIKGQNSQDLSSINCD